MPAKIDGTTGIDLIQDGAVSTAAKLGAQVVTPPKLSGGQSGNPPIFGARAWCVFNGTLTGTNAPLAGGNVTSVTRNAPGSYTINFSTPMPDTAYATSAVANSNVGTRNTYVCSNTGAGAAFVAPTVNSCTVFVTDSVGAVDAASVSVVIFR